MRPPKKIMFHSKGHLEAMLQDLVDEAARWDLAPKPASVVWTSTLKLEEKSELVIINEAVRHSFLFEEKFKILACAMNRKGKTHEAIKERTQSANKSLLEQQFDSQKPGCSVDN